MNEDEISKLVKQLNYSQMYMAYAGSMDPSGKLIERPNIVMKVKQGGFYGQMHASVSRASQMFDRQGLVREGKELQRISSMDGWIAGLSIARKESQGEALSRIADMGSDDLPPR